MKLPERFNPENFLSLITQIQRITLEKYKLDPYKMAIIRIKAILALYGVLPYLKILTIYEEKDSIQLLFQIRLDVDNSNFCVQFYIKENNNTSVVIHDNSKTFVQKYEDIPVEAAVVIAADALSQVSHVL